MSDYYLGSMPLLVDEQLKEIRMAGYAVHINSLSGYDEWSIQTNGPLGNVGNIGYSLSMGVYMVWQLLCCPSELLSKIREEPRELRGDLG